MYEPPATQRQIDFLVQLGVPRREAEQRSKSEAIVEIQHLATRPTSKSFR